MPVENQFSVLLVDDDNLDAEVVRRAFSKQGVAANLEHADSGEGAMSILDKRVQITESGPLVIFLDLNMPGVNGHEFLSLLRSSERFKKVTVFVLSTSDHERDVQQAYAKNVAGYFTKNNLDALIDVLKTYIDSALLPEL